MTLEPPEPRPTRELLGLIRGLSTLPSALLPAASGPRGQGETVLVVPGFLTGDGSTWALRAFLAQRGYRPRGWEMGRNMGKVPHLVPQVVRRIHELSEESGQPIAIVGWSLGGLLAREAARRTPERVRHIVTLGTPIVGGPKYTVAAGSFRRRGVDLDTIEAQVARANAARLPVGVTAVYSRRDGVVAWRACLDPNAGNRVDHVEVGATHAELPFSVPVMRVVADALHRAFTEERSEAA